MADPDDAAASSPCLGTCTLDRVSGFCVGCLRSRAEVTAWREMTPAQRRLVLAALPARRAALLGGSR